MRKFYFFLLFLLTAFVAFSQQPFQEKYFNGMKQISAMEKTSFSNSAKYQMHTVSSNNFDVHFYRCEWEVDPTVRYIKGKITSHFTITASTASISYDLHASLVVDSVRYHNSPLTFSRSIEHGLTINFPASLPVNRVDSISIYYQGIPANEEGGSFITRVFNTRP